MIVVRIDPGSCMAAQRCAYLAPQVFRLGGDGIAEVVDPAAASADRVIEIARECPNLAIRVWRDGILVAGEAETS
jgi:ferredoxin